MVAAYLEAVCSDGSQCICLWCIVCSLIRVLQHSMSLLCHSNNHMPDLVGSTRAIHASAAWSYTTSLVHVVRANKHRGLGTLTSYYVYNWAAFPVIDLHAFPATLHGQKAALQP